MTPKRGHADICGACRYPIGKTGSSRCPECGTTLGYGVELPGTVAQRDILQALAAKDLLQGGAGAPSLSAYLGGDAPAIMASVDSTRLDEVRAILDAHGVSMDERRILIDVNEPVCPECGVDLDLHVDACPMCRVNLLWTDVDAAALNDEPPPTYGEADDRPIIGTAAIVIGVALAAFVLLLLRTALAP